MPVLAKGTAEVAAGKTQGKDRRAGAEVVEGLFFDGVPGNGGDVAAVGED
jgi:hypothetical protein